MNELSLFSKVALIVAGMMLVGGVGAWVGRNIRSLVALIGIWLCWLVGTFVVVSVANSSGAGALPLLAIWSFASGLVVGPSINIYASRLGWQTVCLAFCGTGGVMAACGAVGMLSGLDFSGMGSFLMFALFGLIIFGVIRIFVAMSRTVNIVHAIIGMIVFAGFFIYDFFVITKSENSWSLAIVIAMNIYLDFLNFFLYLLQLLAAVQDK